MSREKKSLKEKLSDAAVEVNKTGQDNFKKLASELGAEIPRLTVAFHEKLQGLDFVEAEKKNAKIGYRRALDEGDQETMDLCLKKIREQNAVGEKLRTEIAEFPALVKKLYERKNKIFAIARADQEQAESGLREAEKLLEAARQRIRRYYALMGSINDLNKSVEDIIRGFKKAVKEASEEVKPPRSNLEGFWLEVDDPFAVGTLHNYERLKGVDGLQLPYVLPFKDKEKAAVDETYLKTKFEKSESQQAEFGDVHSYIEFKSKIITQVLEYYILVTAGGGDQRREFAAKVALQKCR